MYGTDGTRISALFRFRNSDGTLVVDCMALVRIRGFSITIPKSEKNAETLLPRGEVSSSSSQKIYKFVAGPAQGGPAARPIGQPRPRTCDFSDL